MLVLAKRLKALRQTFGLSALQLARFLRVADTAVLNFENNRMRGKVGSQDKQRILAFINAHPIQQNDNLDWVERHFLEIQEREREKQKFYRHFIAGRAYSISKQRTDPAHGGNKAKEVESECVFIYVGKQGKHHVFREATGGWSRTYTDAQLVDRKVLEVRA